MENDPRPLMPGDRVKVFDHVLFKDDVSTPLSFTMRPATIIRRYGYRIHYPVSDVTYQYNDVVDVLFDHRPERESRGHFTRGLMEID